ncbi:MAG: DNA primase [Planctomycetes bacterium]|nr:DNA primase [Planctomycetota bacterium]
MYAPLESPVIDHDPFDPKEQVRQATDIVDLVGGYLDLRRQGRVYRGLCPFHDDSRPSLHVDPERQFWKCWVCDVGGDVFSFVMHKEGVSFREALEMLAERAGITLRRSPQTKVEPGSPQDKRTLYAALEWAAKQYHQCFLNSPEAAAARKYVEERQIARESVERFHIGFAPNAWQWLIDRARTTPFTGEVLQAAGLAGKSEQGGRHYDLFRGRVMFPIRDTQRQCVALGGRILPEFADDRTGKYYNSPETKVFHKSEQFYGLDLARDSAEMRSAKAPQRSIVVVEGYTDVVMAHQCGVGNAIAVLGTALNEKHIRILRRFTDTIYLVLDGDEAGQRRTNEILELFVAEQVDVRIVTPPEGLDPCDFLLARGGDAFRDLLDHAVDALEHKVRGLTVGLNPASDTHRAHQAVEEILSVLAKAPRLHAGTEASLRMREQQMLARLSRQFLVDEGELRARLRELRRAAKPRSGDRSQPALTTPLAPTKMGPGETELLEIMTLDRDLAERAVEEISASDLTTPAARGLFSAFRRLYEQGQPLDLLRVMTEVEDAHLKSLLVELDENARAKEEKTQQSAPERLETLIGRLLARREEQERRQKEAALEQGSLSDDEQLRLLLELHEQDKRKYELH